MNKSPLMSNAVLAATALTALAAVVGAPLKWY